MGTVLAVSIGPVRVYEWQGRRVSTAIFKSPVDRPVVVRFDRLEGDGRGDLRFHGAPHNAVHAYAIEDLRWWSDELGCGLGPGAMGENLTLEGIDVSEEAVGEQWRVGSALLEVVKRRTPCRKLGLRFGDPTFPARFLHAGRLGLYLRVLEEGVITAGDQVVRVPPPEGAATRYSRPGSGTR
jgi:MOSC domain-containing protein YiiM